jgi:hypothetical protein
LKLIKGEEKSFVERLLNGSIIEKFIKIKSFSFRLGPKNDGAVDHWSNYFHGRHLARYDDN